MHPSELWLAELEASSLLFLPARGADRSPDGGQGQQEGEGGIPGGRQDAGTPGPD